ncbi:MAG: CBS domain-containing protein, partial [Gemmatimonadaceae bacterium]
TSIVFAFETTRQPLGMLPLLAGCTAAYLVALLLGRHSIMTEKIARRGASLRTDYTVDFLGQVRVRDVATREVVTLRARDTVGSVRDWLAGEGSHIRHQGFPVLDGAGGLIGVVTRREIMDPEHPVEKRIGNLVSRPPIVVYEDNTLRDAADQMVAAEVGRLPVVEREAPHGLVGIISRSDLLTAHAPRLDAASRMQPVRGFSPWSPKT